MRISLLKTSHNDSDSHEIQVKISEFDDAQAELVHSHCFDLRECEKGKPIAINVFNAKPPPVVRRLRDYGKTLFKALFSESTSARKLLHKVLSSSVNGRILLELNGDNDLDAIPWEYTWAFQEYLVYQCMFTRMQQWKDNWLPRQPLPPLPLHIFFVTPDPVDLTGSGLSKLYLSDQLQRIFNDHSAIKQEVILERVFPPTIDRMETLIPNKSMSTSSETAKVLHFMGHCRVYDGKALIFEHKETGEAEYIDAFRLATISQSLRLVFLCACDTRDIARDLVKNGIPYAIGSNCAIPDDLARDFESKFYQLLAAGRTVEEAMYMARRSFLGENERRDYFSGAIVLYSSTFRESDGTFERKTGQPKLKRHMPPNNINSLYSARGFGGREKELVKLNTVLRRMGNRGEQFCHVYTIVGDNGQSKMTLALEAMEWMAHLFPGGIFTWVFDRRKKTSVMGYLWRLVEVIFKNNDEIVSRLKERCANDAGKLELTIVDELESRATSLLIIDDADILKYAEEEKNVHAVELGRWLRKVASTAKIPVKILATSREPLGWLDMKEETMSLNSLNDLDINSGGQEHTIVRDTITNASQYFSSNLDINVEYKAKTTGKNLSAVNMYGTFIGRQKELERLGQLLEGSTRYVTIKGFGGVGKTSLAFQAVSNFNHGSVLALSLVGTQKVVEVIQNIAHFLSIDTTTSSYSEDLIIQTLGREEGILLFLDNMEGVKHAIDRENKDLAKKKEAKALLNFFKRLPKNVKILATSRIALGWPDEKIIELDGLAAQEGVKVLHQWSSHRKDEIDNESGMKLSRLVNGHPLSLRLLGGVFNNCGESIGEFIISIRHWLQNAIDDEATDERQESISSCMEYSLDHLSEALTTFLGQLNMFEIPFTSTLAMRILKASDNKLAADQLHRLWQHSWLNRFLYEEDPMLGDWRPKIIENDKYFYSVHPRIREFLDNKFDKIEDIRSVILNDSEIQFYIALCYGVGFGVVNNLERQIEYCEKAATEGHLEAQQTLAICYDRGLCGVQTNPEKAFHWYLKVAQAGDRQAQGYVALCYERGRDCERNDEKSKYWYEQAQKNTTNLQVKFDLTLPLLHRAAKGGKLELVRSLVEQQRATLDMKDGFGQTPLHLAAEGGHAEVVRSLVVEFGADVNAMTNSRKTPLHLAAERGHAEVVRSLVVECGADVNAMTELEETPLHLAAEGGHAEVVRSLVVEFGADVNAMTKYVEGGHAEVVRSLVVEFGADVNAMANSRKTPLHLAAEDGHAEAVRSLVVEFRADVNAMTKNEKTPLHLAAERGHAKIVRLLVVEFGADVNAMTGQESFIEDERTPLHLAAERGHAEVVRSPVVECGADVNAMIVSFMEVKWTPLHLAAERGHAEVVRSLVVECGADVNAMANYGETPLHLAVERGHAEVVRSLVVECGADVNFKTEYGETPLQVATRGRHAEIVQLLVAFGADIIVKEDLQTIFIP